jgi:hypothetical protein
MLDKKSCYVDNDFQRNIEVLWPDISPSQAVYFTDEFICLGGTRRTINKLIGSFSPIC